MIKKITAVLLGVSMAFSSFGAVCTAKTEREEKSEVRSTLVYSTTYKLPKSGRNYDWRESMVTGNGENGALVAGGPTADVHVYQHMMFNMPTNDLRETPDWTDNLETVRQDLINMRTPTTTWNMQYDYTFHPSHQLNLKFEDAGSITDYKRWTDYETAEVGVNYKNNLGEWERRVFASRKDNVVITHITSSSTGSKINLSLTLQDLADMSYENKQPDANTRYKRLAGEDGSYLGHIAHYPSYENSELKNAGFASVTRVVTIGGSKKRVDLGVIDDAMAVSGSRNYGIEITDAEEVFLITKSQRDLNMGEYSAFSDMKEYSVFEALLNDTNAVTLKSEYKTGGKLDYDKILAPHALLHGKEFNAVTLKLNGAEADRNLTNEELLSKQRSSTSKMNNAMVERAFYAGRYAAVCSSGYAAPRLGGMWCMWGGNWQADWTTDANVNLQMSGMNLGNIMSGINGYISFILRIVDDWEGNAKAIYGMEDAIMAPPRTDGDRGGVVHFSRGYPFQYWNAGASWLLLPIYEYWLCHGDLEITLADDIDIESLKSVLDLTNNDVKELKTTRTLNLAEGILLPLLTKQANFWEQLVDARYYEDEEGNIHYDANKTELNEGERYLILPSYSPENRPNGNYQNQLTINGTMDIAAAKDGLAMTVAIEKAVGKDGFEERCAKWEALYEKMPTYKYDETGAFREWAVYDYKENHAHRHISHTYPAWPAHESRGNREMEAGLAKSIEMRKANSGDKKSGHGWLHTGLVDARLRNGEGVKEALLMIISGQAYYTSMMTNHNVTGDSAYCTDMLITMPSLVMESLAYTNVGEIEILPALNTGWTSGEIKGMRARSEADIDSVLWNLDEKWASCTITSDKDGNEIKLRCAELWDAVTVDGKASEVFEDEAGRYVLLSLNKGESSDVEFTLSDERDGIRVELNGEEVDEITLDEGDAVILTAETKRSGLTGGIWSSNNIGILTVENGKIYAHNSGVETIKIELAGMEKEIKVTVAGEPMLEKAEVVEYTGSAPYNGGWSLSNAFDGRGNTSYSSKDDTSMKHIEVELAHSLPVSEIYLIGRYSVDEPDGKFADRINGAKIYASNTKMNGSIENAVYLGEASGVTATSECLPAKIEIDTKGEDYKYYMLYFDKVNNGSSISMALGEASFYINKNDVERFDCTIKYTCEGAVIGEDTVELFNGEDIRRAFTKKEGNVTAIGDYLYKITGVDYADTVVTVNLEKLYRLGEVKENIAFNGGFEEDVLDYWRSASGKSLREVNTFAPASGGSLSLNVSGYFSGGYTLVKENGNTVLKIDGNKKANPSGTTLTNDSYSSTQSGSDQCRVMNPIAYWDGAEGGKEYYISFDIKADTIHTDANKKNYVYFGAYENKWYKNPNSYGINFGTRLDHAGVGNITSERYTKEADRWYTVNSVINTQKDGYFGFQLSWANDWGSVYIDNIEIYEIDTRL